jgi:hypothetical protein
VYAGHKKATAFSLWLYGILIALSAVELANQIAIPDRHSKICYVVVTSLLPESLCGVDFAWLDYVVVDELKSIQLSYCEFLALPILCYTPSRYC